MLEGELFQCGHLLPHNWTGSHWLCRGKKPPNPACDTSARCFGSGFTRNPSWEISPCPRKGLPGHPAVFQATFGTFDKGWTFPVTKRRARRNAFMFVGHCEKLTAWSPPQFTHRFGREPQHAFQSCAPPQREQRGVCARQRCAMGPFLRHLKHLGGVLAKSRTLETQNPR